MRIPKVYVNIPANAIAGGVESLFQLSDAINNTGGDSFVVWDYPTNVQIPEKYKHYNVKSVTTIEDDSNNWIIYPEVWTEKLGTYNEIQQSVWWLSVDNNHGKFQEFNNPKITHFYQSFYALNFLEKNKTYKYLPLFDYIPSKFTDEEIDFSIKKNIVCYNPIKGIEITNQVKILNPDIEFVPITNMNENQIIDLLKLSKVYIDFGHHPGRDRIPRESASLGNCILTNTKGSAEYYGDIPIDIKYKTSNINDIGNIIRDCFFNYEKNIKDFLLYRKIIKNQKDQLYNLVNQYFNTCF